MRRRRAPHAASVLPSLAGGAVHPVGLGVETVDERHPHLGRQSELARHHPLTIDPVAHRTRRACRRCSSSRSIDPSTTRRASSRSPAIPRVCATASNAPSEPGTAASAAHDLTRLHHRHRTRCDRVARRRTLRQRRRGRQRLAPGPASHRQCAPPTPHHRGRTPAPASPARADAAVHAFAARANSSASRAQSSPDQRSASNRAAASRTATNNSDNRATTLLRTCEPEKKVVEPDPEAYHHPTEHPFGVQDPNFRAQPGRWKPSADPCPILECRRRLLASRHRSFMTAGHDRGRSPQPP